MSNINLWAIHYQDVLRTKYDEFCQLFPINEKIDYNMFVYFVWSNSSKIKNLSGKMVAKIV